MGGADHKDVFGSELKPTEEFADRHLRISRRRFCSEACEGDQCEVASNRKATDCAASVVDPKEECEASSLDCKRSR